MFRVIVYLPKLSQSRLFLLQLRPGNARKKEKFVLRKLFRHQERLGFGPHDRVAYTRHTTRVAFGVGVRVGLEAWVEAWIGLPKKHQVVLTAWPNFDNIVSIKTPQ